jgi:hypothetical protein
MNKCASCVFNEYGEACSRAVSADCRACPSHRRSLNSAGYWGDLLEYDADGKPAETAKPPAIGGRIRKCRSFRPWLSNTQAEYKVRHTRASAEERPPRQDRRKILWHPATESSP